MQNYFENILCQINDSITNFDLKYNFWSMENVVKRME